MCSKTNLLTMLNENQLLEIIKTEIFFLEEKNAQENQLLNEPVPLFLQINAFKTAIKGEINKKLERIALKHSKFPQETCDICLIVPDVKGIKNSEHELHQTHYEKLLKNRGVETKIKKIMTFHEFRTEYDTFELKRRLVELYDVFIVAGNISGKVVRKCGKIFYKKRKVPTSIRLDTPNIDKQIKNVLKKTQFVLHANGDSFGIEIGNSSIAVEKLVENVLGLVEDLNEKFPGGLANVRSINLYAPKGLNIPLFVSLKNPNTVPVPVIEPKSKKSKALRNYPICDELSTYIDADVVVKANGIVQLKRNETLN